MSIIDSASAGSRSHAHGVGGPDGGWRERVLADLGFPATKAPQVREIARGHMFYAQPGPSPESVLFRHADTLGFLGAIGIARIVALTGGHRWAPGPARRRRHHPPPRRRASTHAPH
jgi:hypothetical protein